MRINTINKFQEIFKQIKLNQGDISKLTRYNYKRNSDLFLRTITKLEIDTTPTYYGLYKFLGTTYASTEPSPSEAYKENDNGTYSFIFPVWNFPALLETDPEDYTYGATPWELQAYIAVIYTRTVFPNLKEKILDGSRIISQLTKLNGESVSDVSITLREKGQNQDAITVDFNYFYRWMKLINNNGGEEDGLALDYYAIYPIQKDSEEPNLILDTSIYFYNLMGEFYGQAESI